MRKVINSLFYYNQPPKCVGLQTSAVAQEEDVICEAIFAFSRNGPSVQNSDRTYIYMNHLREVRWGETTAMQQYVHLASTGMNF